MRNPTETYMEYYDMYLSEAIERGMLDDDAHTYADQEAQEMTEAYYCDQADLLRDIERDAQ